MAHDVEAVKYRLVTAENRHPVNSPRTHREITPNGNLPVKKTNPEPQTQTIKYVWSRNFGKRR